MGVRCKTAVGAMLSDFRTLGFVSVSTFELVNPYWVRTCRISAGMVARDILKPSGVEFCDGGGSPPGVSRRGRGVRRGPHKPSIRRHRRPRQGLGVPGDIGLERIDRVTERNGGAVISGLGHGVICGVIRSGERFAVEQIHHAHKSRQNVNNPIRVANTYRSELFVTAM